MSGVSILAGSSKPCGDFQNLRTGGADLLENFSIEGIAVFAIAALVVAMAAIIHRSQQGREANQQANELVDSLQEAIETVDLNPTQKVILLNRHLSQVQILSRKAHKYKSRLFWLSISMIFTNFLIHILGSVGNSADINPSLWIAVVTAVQSSILAVKELSGFEVKALNSKDSLAKVLSELWSYLAQSGQYAGSSHPEAFPEVCGDVEEVLLGHAQASFPRSNQPHSPQLPPSPQQPLPQTPPNDDALRSPAGFKVAPSPPVIDTERVIPVEDLRIAALRIGGDRANKRKPHA